ncbi:protocadherin gamma-B5-like isoform X20 [Pithys albifrons albifrons]|uniref:protocadherin gamma-B5-like isoform X20 n=1 Tax=Pithys albifrons albifrons TaxID=3385563 RepID=UPI003A5D022E
MAAGRRRQSRGPAGGRALLLLLLPAVLLCLCCRAAAERLRYTIPEELARGSLVGPLARDLGLSPEELPVRKLRLSAEKQYFTLREENGNLYVNERLDREELCGESSSCSVSFEALVHNPLNAFHVEVSIQDVNDNSPAFRKGLLELEISEWTLPGARFPLEVARDADVGSNSQLTYQLTRNPSFSLGLKETPDGSQQPQLVLERALDREKQSSFELILTALDGGEPMKSGTVQVRVNVTDANDNPPVFSKSVYEARVAENLPAGSLVLRVRATDADAGSNGVVSYSFGNVPEVVCTLFAVDSESGEQAQPNTDWRFSQTQRPGTSGSQNGEEAGAWPNNQFDTEMLQAMILASANEAADGNSTLGGGNGTMGLSARYGPQFTLQHVPDYRQNVYIPGSNATLTNAAGKRDAKNAAPAGGNKKKSGKKEKK